MKQQKTTGYHIQRFQTTEEWKAARPLGIGSSEAGAIMGVNKYSTPYQTWCHKLGIIDPVKENFAMEMGHAMEPWVANQFSLHTGNKVILASQGDWLAIDNEKPYLRVSPDRTYWLPDMKHNAQNKGIAECKTSFTLYDQDAIYTDCMYWYCQLQYQLHVMRYTEGYLCYMCIDRNHKGERWFRHVPYSPTFCNDNLIPRLEEFWFRYYQPALQFIHANHLTDLTNLPNEYWEAINEFAPALTTAEDVRIRYRRHTEGKEVSTQGIQVPDSIAVDGLSQLADIIQHYYQVSTQISQLEETKKSIEDTVKLYMKDAESLTDADGHVIATFRQNKASTKFDVDAFKASHPDIYNQFITTKPGARILRWKK